MELIEEMIAKLKRLKKQRTSNDTDFVRGYRLGIMTAISLGEMIHGREMDMWAEHCDNHPLNVKETM